MSYELFTELSVDQQEVVSGGSITTDVTDDLNTLFKQQDFALVTDISSNKYGSSIKQYTTSQNIKTEASKYYDLKLA
jgi:hypothetical protein